MDFYVPAPGDTPTLPPLELSGDATSGNGILVIPGDFRKPQVSIALAFSGILTCAHS